VKRSHLIRESPPSMAKLRSPQSQNLTLRTRSQTQAAGQWPRLSGPHSAKGNLPQLSAADLRNPQRAIFQDFPRVPTQCSYHKRTLLFTPQG
jgi:hypothetical protein